MGFPSPATDYIETTLTVNSLCNITANSRVILTDRGYVVLDLSLKVKQGAFCSYVLLANFSLQN